MKMMRDISLERDQDSIVDCNSEESVQEALEFTKIQDMNVEYPGISSKQKNKTGQAQKYSKSAHQQEAVHETLEPFLDTVNGDEFGVIPTAQDKLPQGEDLDLNQDLYIEQPA